MTRPEPEPASALDSLRTSDPVMASLIDRLEPIDLATWRTRWALGPFEAIARAVVGQQIAVAAASAIFGRLQTLIGDRDPAVAVAEASDAELRAVGLSAAKAASLRDLAARTLDGRLELDRLDELTDDEARVQLTAVRGIGSWTADMFLLVQLGRPDVLPAGDLGIRHEFPSGQSHGAADRESRGLARPGGRIVRSRQPISTAHSQGVRVCRPGRRAGEPESRRATISSELQGG